MNDKVRSCSPNCCNCFKCCRTGDSSHMMIDGTTSSRTCLLISPIKLGWIIQPGFDPWASWAISWLWSFLSWNRCPTTCAFSPFMICYTSLTMSDSLTTGSDADNYMILYDFALDTRTGPPMMSVTVDFQDHLKHQSKVLQCFRGNPVKLKPMWQLLHWERSSFLEGKCHLEERWHFSSERKSCSGANPRTSWNCSCFLDLPSTTACTTSTLASVSSQSLDHSSGSESMTFLSFSRGHCLLLWPSSFPSGSLSQAPMPWNKILGSSAGEEAEDLFSLTLILSLTADLSPLTQTPQMI